MSHPGADWAVVLPTDQIADQRLSIHGSAAAHPTVSIGITSQIPYDEHRTNEFVAAADSGSMTRSAKVVTELQPNK